MNNNKYVLILIKYDGKWDVTGMLIEEINCLNLFLICDQYQRFLLIYILYEIR